ncbi:MAG: hypothetical protein ACRD4O_13250, partial [Bryobacteraceae bacterium]
SLQALIDNNGRGRSQPFTLAQLVRLPRIESFLAGPGQDPDGTRPYTLTGYDLEMIGEAGWDADHGTDIEHLPAPVPGEGQKQILHLGLPDPPKAQAPLYLWLRGETTGRATTILGPALPQGAHTAAPTPPADATFRMPALLPPVLQAPMPPAPAIALPAASSPPPMNSAAKLAGPLPLPAQRR